MKKILVVLSVVAMMLTSCENGGENAAPVKPNFPEPQSFEAVAGGSYELTFVAEKEWTISLSAESQSAAFLIYDGFPESSHSGEAGEHTVTVKMREGIISYAKDIVTEVQLSMVGFTETIATYTIARTEFPVNVMGLANAGSEETVKSTFSKGGHPEDGPFASAPHTYTLRHNRGIDAMYAEFYVQHDLDASRYNYAVYVRNSKGEFIAVDLEDANSWVQFVSFGAKGEKFRLYMNYNKARKTKDVGYDAYVNLEDENGDALVSVYHVYDPDKEVIVETSMKLADAALAAEKGVVMAGANMNYTLTLPSADILTTDYLAAALKFSGYSEIYGGFGSGTQNLVFEHNAELDVYYVRLAPEASIESLQRTEVLNISAVGDTMHSYTINLVFDWIEGTEGDITTDYSASFVNVKSANSLGATLEKIEANDADFDSEWGISLQYRMTYTSAELFKVPAQVALNIPGFEYGTVSNIHSENSADDFLYSDALDFAKDSVTSEVLLTLKEGVEAESIPNGKCDLLCADASGKKFIRILFVVNVEK